MDYFAPLVVVQIIAGILLRPGILGAFFPDYYKFVFNPQVFQALNGIAWWAVMAACGFTADWAGLHFIVGVLLAGAITDGAWFDQKHMDLMRHCVT